MNRRIAILGPFEIASVLPFLRASDIFVFPSRREGFGTVQIEAVACGWPCLVNNHPVEQTGFRIADNKVNDFVVFSKRLLTDRPLRHEVGKAARRRAEERFSIDTIAQQYIDFYSALLNQAR